MSWNDVKGLYFEEKMMWLAVLRRAVFDFVLYKGIAKKSKTWKHAKRFVFHGERGAGWTRDGGEYIEGLNFDEVCALWTWNPSYVRRLTKLLTREDVRKLESGRFRSEFVIDAMSIMALNNLRWSYGATVPFFPPHNYSLSYKRAMTPRVIKMERGGWYPIPWVQWTGILVDENMVSAMA